MDARLVASRMPGLAMYGAPYTSQPFPGYLPYGSPVDPSAFYTPVPAGENAEAWRAGLSQAAAAAYYDPQLAAHYGYGYGPIGLADGARRKNATRETTSTLKAWLNEHRKNPYPTKGEKIMLAIITKMTLTQVSTWFANARRRLKKENKMTWSPRNRCGEDDDDDIMEDGEGNSDVNNAHNHNQSGSSDSSARNGEGSGNSRTSSPAHFNPGSDRAPSFDLPQGMGHHAFLARSNLMAEQARRLENERKTSENDDEEIDLESLDENKKDVKPSDALRRQGEHHLHSTMTSPKPGQPIGLPGSLSFPPQHRSAMLAASRGLPVHPHLMNNHPLNRQLSGPAGLPPKHLQMATPTSANAISRNSAVSPTSSTTSLPSSISSPTKPKIWSLADVATSNDAPKPRSGSPAPTTMSTATSSSPLPSNPARHPNMISASPAFQQEAIRNWVDGVMQQQKQMAMAAAAMAGAHSHSFLPQAPGMIPQNLAAALNPAALAALSRNGAGPEHRTPENNRFHPYGLADFAAAQHRATMAAAQAAGFSVPGSKPVSSPSPTYTTSSNKAMTSPTDCVLPDKTSSPQAPTSPVSSSSMEVTKFPTIASRPASNDSGIASAEAGKDNKQPK